jgi:hypothetical protein
MARQTRRRLAWAHERCGDSARSTQIHLANLDDARAAGDRLVEATETGVLSGRAIDEGRYRDAVEMAASALELHLELGASYEVVVDLHRFARAFGGLGLTLDAARLTGAIERWHHDHGFEVADWIDAHLKELLAAAETALGAEASAAAEQEGGRMSFDEAVQLARVLTSRIGT